MNRRSSRLDIINAARELASRDPVAARLLADHGPPSLPPAPRRADRFRSLVSSISAQQVSGKAAASIFGRVVDLMGEEFTPRNALELGADQLRSAGLSRSKAESVLNLATHCIDGSVDLGAMGSMDDPDVVAMLTQVRGIGVWTAQMVLLFDLRRIDVWPTGDLGVRVGYANAFDLDAPPTANELLPLGEPFAPYRSIMAWWCWRATENTGDRRGERQALKPNV